MQTITNFPNYALATVNPGLLHDRIRPFGEPLREAHQLRVKFTLKPILQPTNHRPGFSE